MDCIFCKISAGEIPSKKIYEDDKIIAFHDINPQAPVHIIIIPKKHIMSSVDDITPENSGIISDIFLAASKIAKQCGLNNGYRIINNCGKDGAQTVKHLHFHLLGGKALGDKIC
jgi:histidine triad (HIT) family protein